jgi:hypothetical protein
MPQSSLQAAAYATAVHRMSNTKPCTNGVLFTHVGKNRDMTGGAQSWVHISFPGAHFLDHGVSYVCVCGRTVTGKKRDKRRERERMIANYACASYEQVRCCLHDAALVPLCMRRNVDCIRLYMFYGVVPLDLSGSSKRPATKHSNSNFVNYI